MNFNSQEQAIGGLTTTLVRFMSGQEVWITKVKSLECQLTSKVTPDERLDEVLWFELLPSLVSSSTLITP
ncbi:unnamed protein product [Protopolystoma xenopodis]|uniref:Uncharacterized protein n=1 Tax=Protopolystoma xenopodis TaxID=117903 RepID=A0A3S5A5I9_9PLAT|nr:unnamed protein product [Protopolystoma xenopodis]